jgi:hypothetical protein
MRSANGDYRAFLIRAEPMHDEGGRIVRWYGLSTDVEDRRNGGRLCAAPNAPRGAVFQFSLPMGGERA